jgi:predicted phage tail protein
MINVRLHGYLAEKYGASHFFDVKSPQEAARALRANYKEFERDVCEYPHHFQVAIDDRGVTSQTELNLPAHKTIDILPAVRGQVVGGMIAAGAGLMWASTASYFVGMTFFGMSVSSAMASIGLSLVLGGVSRLISKPPEPVAAQAPTEGQADNSGFAFSNTENTAMQGARIPLVYGRVFTGSVVISAGFDVDRIENAS